MVVVAVSLQGGLLRVLAGGGGSLEVSFSEDFFGLMCLELKIVDSWFSENLVVPAREFFCFRIRHLEVKYIATTYDLGFQAMLPTKNKRLLSIEYTLSLQCLFLLTNKTSQSQSKKKTMSFMLCHLGEL